MLSAPTARLSKWLCACSTTLASARSSGSLLLLPPLSSFAGFPKERLKGKTPYEALTGRKPDIRELRVFGCRAYAWIPKERRHGKLDVKAKEGVFVGYSELKKAYIIWLHDQQSLIYSRDVLFDEHRQGLGDGSPFVVELRKWLDIRFDLERPSAPPPPATVVPAAEPVGEMIDDVAAAAPVGATSEPVGANATEPVTTEPVGANATEPVGSGATPAPAEGPESKYK